MKHRKRQELAAGVFALVCLAAGLGIVLWMGGSNLWRKKAQAAWFYAEQGRGRQSLLVGSPVVRGDVPVGKITSMDLDPTGNRVIFGVAIYNESTRIYQDAKARVAAPLVGKDVALAILSCGHEDKGLASIENPIRIETGPLEAITGEFDLKNHASILFKLHALMDSLRDTAGHVHTVSEQVQATLAEAGPSVTHAIKTVDQMATDAAPRVAHTLKTIDEMTTEAAPSVTRTVKTVEAIVTDAQPKVANTLAKVSRTADRVDAIVEKDLTAFLAQLRDINTKVLKTLDNLEGISGDVRQIVAVNRTSINEMVDNMTIMSASLKATAAEVRRNPWRLMYTPTKEEREKDSLLQAARAFSAGATELDQALAKLKSVDPAVADPQAIQGIRDHLKKSFTRFREVEDMLWKQLNK